jgi:hypothetical protein
MASYRFYKIAGNHIIAPGVDRDFDGDGLALDHAESLANGYAIDVWQGSRFIANVPMVNSAPLGTQ